MTKNKGDVRHLILGIIVGLLGIVTMGGLLWGMITEGQKDKAKYDHVTHIKLAKTKNKEYIRIFEEKIENMEPGDTLIIILKE